MKLHVVGGSYIETCIEGDWNQMFGSGLRGASAISQLGEVTLHTYADDLNRGLVEATATTFNVLTSVTGSRRTATFAYEHGLSIPRIDPPLISIVFESPICVTEERILRFGMIEGEAIVDGDCVVYDPQSAYAPQRFGVNGSKAKRLAIVCNRRELALLTNAETDIETAARELFREENAEVLVVKCGSHGAYVLTNEKSEYVPAFETDRIWPIGSGDVFAAAFFAYWSKGKSAIESALNASKSTAFYCQNRALPLPQVEALSEFPEVCQDKFPDPAPIVYLAGPFFTIGERWLVNEARQALQNQGLRVFSPYHDVGLGVASEVVPEDIRALKEADCVFALMDNLDPGTIFEIGYARSLNKPVIVFCQNVSPEALKMLVGTDCTIYDDFVTAIYKSAWMICRQ